MDHQAFAQLLGNYGEFFGSVAVVVTLIYLATQIRQTKVQIENQIEQNTYIQYASSLALMGSEQGSSVLVRGLRSMSELTEEEEVQFYSLVTSGLNALEHQYRLLGPVEGDAVLWNAANYFLQHPGGLEYWQKYRGVYVDEFALWVELHLEPIAAR